MNRNILEKLKKGEKSLLNVSIARRAFFFHPFPLQTLNLQKECPHQAVIKLGSNLLFRISCYTVLEIIWHEGGALLRHHDSA